MKELIKILVVDDNEDLLNTFALILKRKGYLIDTATDGIDAVDKFMLTQFDIVLMDAVMPRMDGIEALHCMREINPKAKIILMTAYYDEPKLRQALSEGAYRALYKPINIAHLMGLIKEITDGSPVLVVDDDADFRESLARILELQKFKVVVAASGLEAIELARQQNFKIAFVDVKMGLMDGLTTAMKLKEINRNLLIVMMTGYRDEVANIVNQALKEGALKCLYKPFDIEEVKELATKAV